MTTDAMHASVTFLTWDQLTDAMIVSCDEYERRFAAFLTASETEITHAMIGRDHAEAHAAAEACWIACKAQQAMTGAIAREMRARQIRKDYGPTNA